MSAAIAGAQKLAIAKNVLAEVIASQGNLCRVGVVAVRFISCLPRAVIKKLYLTKRIAMGNDTGDTEKGGRRYATFQMRML